jgi:hypothetical protein
MFSLSDYLAMSSEVDEYDLNVVDQILCLGKTKKPTQVVSKYNMVILLGLFITLFSVIPNATFPIFFCSILHFGK